MTSTTVKELLASLDKSPWDESLLGVIGDAMEDEGNPLHFGIRYMIQNNRYPSFWMGGGTRRSRRGSKPSL